MSIPLNILCIETAIGATSVALVKEIGCFKQLIAKDKNMASETLHLLIQQLMKETSTTFQELSAIAISGGPGSYTGLRIGAASAKGLCFSLDIPLIHLETLKIMQEGLKRQVKKQFDYYIPMIDARRNDVYTAILDDNGSYLTTPVAQTLEKAYYSKICLNNSVVFLGDGTQKFLKEIQDLNAHCYPELSPESQDMAKMAIQNFQKKNFQEVAYYEPFYYKAFYTPKI